MKDNDFIMNLDVQGADIAQVKKEMEKNGWYIHSSIKNGKCRVNLYESEEDFDFWKDLRSTFRAENFEAAFRGCLLDIQEYYKARQND